MDPILHWVSTYGYLAIFGLLVLGIAGLPVPDETLLVFSGYLVSRGGLNPAGALVAAFCGSACGITVSFTIGRTVGIGVVHRYGGWLHLTEARINRVHEWFEHVGHWALVVGYFIPGVRHLTAIVAGTSGLEYRRFAAFAYGGALLWVCTFLSLGYLLGDRWEEAERAIHRHLVTGVLVAAGVLAIYLIFRWLRNRKGD